MRIRTSLLRLDWVTRHLEYDKLHKVFQFYVGELMSPDELLQGKNGKPPFKLKFHTYPVIPLKDVASVRHRRRVRILKGQKFLCAMFGADCAKCGHSA